MKQKPTVLNRHIIAKSRLFCIEELHLRFSNNEERFYERFISLNHGAVLIVPMLNEDTLLLVREYAAGIEDYLLSFPKGLIDEGEDAIIAANRELQEEVGYGAKRIETIMRTTASPGYWGNAATIVLARDLYPSQLPGDEPEPLEVIPWKIKDYQDLLHRADFTEARSIAALLLVKEML